MVNPVSTYRIQVHKDFTLEHIKNIVPYLQKLGVGTLYLAPIFEATPGSTHGYDGVNPHKINPETGTEKQIYELDKLLKENKMGWLQDIVPNHMAFHQHNKWLFDVLEKGRKSSFADYFDIGWNGAIHTGRLMAPFLGAEFSDVAKNGEIKLDYCNQRLVFNYYGNLYPLKPESYPGIFQYEGRIPDAEIFKIIERINLLSQIYEPAKYEFAWESLRIGLGGIVGKGVGGNDFERLLKQINSNPEFLESLEAEQHYKLCYWKDTDSKINYRRFFTINGLICLNIQNDQVFDDFHRFVKELLDKKIFTGLRIDHIDGLNDPEAYISKLRKLAGDDAYIVVEKILEINENLPEQWPMQGNTGYDFLALLNNLFTNKNSEEKFTNYYNTLTGNSKSIQQQISEKKAYMLYNHFAGELENLYQLFLKPELVSVAELPEDLMKSAIAEILIQFPVYRFYGNTMPLDNGELEALKKIFSGIKKNKPELKAAMDLIEQVFSEKVYQENSEYRKNSLHFYQRLMQFAGPLMAKGVEDTLMYTYNRYIGNNEVGDSPLTFGISKELFHAHMKYRQEKWPLSLNATATHDTKRGEDVNARINVLTDIPDEWIKTVSLWREQNKNLKTDNAPDANDEYFIYKTLVGTFPIDEGDKSNYAERLKQYMQKALREGKVNSDWSAINVSYEKATSEFIDGLLDSKRDFWKSFKKFHEKNSDVGIVNSLSKTVLKFTCPGVPDVYQGCELWDFSMVDPDNRRPVDYKKRIDLLDQFRKETQADENNFLKKLWDSRENGNIKLWLTHTLLQLRKENSVVFEKGNYIPLEVDGKYKDHVLAFARHYKNHWLLVAVPVGLGSRKDVELKDVLNLDWEDTAIVLPADVHDIWIDSVSNQSGILEDELPVKEIFSKFPFAVLKLQNQVTDRSAGILMHITSLPSKFGVGDFGPEARVFADFLAKSRQKYWQLLPLNITEAGMGYSPYSSISSIAGNTLLISPEILAEKGLIKENDLRKYVLPITENADFKAAEKVRNEIFEVAFAAFKSGSFPALENEFTAFCKKESYWLNDFSLYVVLKKEFKKAWYDWPVEYKKRDKKALAEYSVKNEPELDKVKWLQFVFFSQWASLKKYCNDLEIKLFGDLPFYVSHDSADVWTNPEIFALDADSKITGVAGVPPDYFNSDGQLWGMPVFRWDVLKSRNYDWWVTRLKKNIELYDVVRLDHFRAFYDYWEVPAGSATAKTGKWKLGPGNDFFNVLKNELGDLPFIAEDLGDINEGVHKLRDDLKLPGMKILQFAFGKDIPGSIYIPHNFVSNYIAYTGTHDNNTTVGWYRQEAKKTERKNLELYTGIKTDESTIHLVMGRLAYGSVAKTVILPVQDVIGIDESARMNIPASVDKNWVWRLMPGQLQDEHSQRLKKWVRIFNR